MTTRQCEVLSYASIGLRDHQIAALLGLSPWTVKTHIRHAVWELRAHSRTHAVAIAIRKGLV